MTNISTVALIACQYYTRRWLFSRSASVDIEWQTFALNSYWNFGRWGWDKENNEIKLKVLAKEWEALWDHTFITDPSELTYTPTAPVFPKESLGCWELLQQD